MLGRFDSLSFARSLGLGHFARGTDCTKQSAKRFLVAVKGMIILAPVVVLLPNVNATTLHVPGEYPTIQAGIDAAAPGDTVLVAPGTYTGTGNRNLDFAGKDIVLLSEEGAEATIIDVELFGRGFYFKSGETNDALVKGFTVQKGWTFYDYGAGLRIKSSSPTIEDCIIWDNKAYESAGGGISCEEGASPVIVNCLIAGNLASYGSGAGVLCLNASPTLVGCTLSGNESGDFGGGISCDGASSPNVVQTIVWGNCVLDASAYGSSSSITFTCCAVGSTRTDAGGEIHYDGEQVFEDPLFCAPVPCSEAPTQGGRYTLAEGSPCLPENSPCGELIGALGQGCQTPSSVPGVVFPELRDRPALIAPSPNPSTGWATCGAVLPRPGRAVVHLFDVNGRVARKLFDAILPAGRRTFTLSPSGAGETQLSSGIYYLRLDVEGAHDTRKVVITK